MQSERVTATYASTDKIGQNKTSWRGKMVGETFVKRNLGAWSYWMPASNARGVDSGFPNAAEREFLRINLC